MTALSLFEDDPADSPAFGDARDDHTRRRGGRRDDAMDPAVVRPARPVFRNVDPRGTTIPALVLSVLMVSPGIWRYAQDELTFSVLLQRFVLITLATVAVLEVVRRYLARTIVDPDADDVDPGDAAADGADDLAAWDEAPVREPAPVPVSPATTAAIDAGLDPALALLAGER